MEPIKLHLGCGEQYMPGYVNIDYPSDHHTVSRVKADKYADLKELSYPEGSVAEIRLHHVFEHFSRQWALKVLADWHRWLAPGGKLIIETPDFDANIELYRTADLEYRFVLLRHIFGSHEASWAYHYDGWGEQKYRFVLEKFGFENLEFKKVLAYHSRLPFPLGGIVNRTPFEEVKNATGDRLANITVTAVKSARPVDTDAAIRDILKMSMAGKEDAMYAAWLKDIGMEA